MLSYDRPVSFSGRFASARSLIPCLLQYVRGIPLGLVVWSKPPDHDRAFGHPVPCSSGASDKETPGSPKFPSSLWCHAPLSDPGGVPPTCHTVDRTAAFRSFHRVGFACPACAAQLSSCPPLYSFRGSITRPGILLPPAPYAPCGVCTRSSLLPCWLGFREVGLAPRSARPLENIDLFHEVISTP
jgi:hypothetical protein